MNIKNKQSEVTTDNIVINHVSQPEGFINTEELLKRIPISLGTLRNWKAAGKIPFINVGARRVLYHWPSVESKLIQMQKG